MMLETRRPSNASSTDAPSTSNTSSLGLLVSDDELLALANDDVEFWMTLHTSAYSLALSSSPSPSGHPLFRFLSGAVSPPSKPAKQRRICAPSGVESAPAAVPSLRMRDFLVALRLASAQSLCDAASPSAQARSTPSRTPTPPPQPNGVTKRGHQAVKHARTSLPAPFPSRLAPAAHMAHFRLVHARALANARELRATRVVVAVVVDRACTLSTHTDSLAARLSRETRARTTLRPVSRKKLSRRAWRETGSPDWLGERNERDGPARAVD